MKKWFIFVLLVFLVVGCAPHRVPLLVKYPIEGKIVDVCDPPDGCHEHFVIDYDDLKKFMEENEKD